MDDVLAAIPFGGIGLSGIVAYGILAIIRGDLVTRKQHEEVKADRDEWRRLFLELMDVNAKAIEAAETTTAVLNALPRPSREEPPS